jgi:hypothetical protein
VTATGVLVYGVLPAGTAPPEGLTGLDGEPVRIVAGGRLAAAVADLELERPPGRRKELLAYHAVVDALAERGPVAPIRFGSVLEDEEAVVHDLLLAREATLARLLEDLRGRRQFNLRATYVEEVVLAEIVATNPEVRQLRERTRDLPEEASYRERVRLGELVARELEQLAADDAAMLLDAVLPYAVGHVVRSRPGGPDVLDVALLVDEARAGALEEHLEALAEAVHERIRLRLVGPVAAYDFADGA